MKTKIESFDRARVIANYMRCCIHCFVPYMVYNHGMWFFQAEPSNRFFDYSIFSLHAFVMEVFMFIAGYFSANKQSSFGSVAKRNFQRFFIPTIVSALLTIPLLFVLQAIYFNGFNDVLSHAFDIFKQTIASNGIPMAHYWFIFYVILFAFIGYIAPKKSLLLGFVCIAIGLAINNEAMIRNPIYVEIKWPSFFYYLGYFLLGKSMHQITEFKFLGKVWIWAIVFIISLAFSGIYITAYQAHQHLFLDVFLQPFLFGICALSGSVMFMQLMEKSSLHFSAYQVESTYFLYLFHLPIAIATQMLFKMNQVKGFWVPFAVVIVSVSFVHLLNMTFGKQFFKLCDTISTPKLKPQ